MAKQDRQKQPKQPQQGQGRGEPTAAPKSPAAGPATWLRGLLSAIAVWHLFVVFISPFSVPPTSQLVFDIAQSKWVRWYSDSLYLNHGYHFFGPEPPTNQLVRYQVTDDAGQIVVEGEFPNKEQQWPRLFYHRHMMLADQANLGPGDISAEDWMRFSMRAYGRQLLRQHGGDRVRVDCVVHNLLFPTQSVRGDDPNAPELFIPVLSVEETAASLEQPLPIPEPPQPELPAALEAVPVEGAL